MTQGDLQRRASQRADMVAAAREHSAAVALHLDRVARRLRSRADDRNRTVGAGRGNSVPGQGHVPGQGLGPLAVVDELSTLLLVDAGLDDMLGKVVRLVQVGVEQADGVSVTLLREGHLETTASTSDTVIAADTAQYTLRQGPCVEAATGGDAVLTGLLPDTRWPAFGPRAAALGWQSLMSVPLRTRAGTLGALNLYARDRDAFGTADLDVCRAFADHAAVALTNARDFREQQLLAASLQRHLLPASLPAVPGLRLSARYRPASSGINVGGDWYDVLPLPDGTVALVIGDVAGHGVGAAMTMGRLRTAVRAYALEGHEPCRVMALVDRFLQLGDPEGYATCCYVVVDARARELRWCNAGHLAPVLVPGPGPAHLAPGTHGPPLGAPAGGHATGAAVPFDPGTRLLLFTDGLVERRRESLDTGLDRLVRSASGRAAGEGLEAWCERVVAEQLEGREVGDDVAVLAVELEAAGGGVAGSPWAVGGLGSSS